VLRLVGLGADIIELGIPFSDPVADGPVIQEADARAFKKGATLAKVLAFVARLRRDGCQVPIVLFSYFNPILSMGLEAFADRCAAADVDGVLVVDLPAEESRRLGGALRQRRIEPVMLASPTTSDQRLKVIARASGSIVYYVSREGVTGARKGLGPGLAARLRKVRALMGKPLIVGFGISKMSHVKKLKRMPSDGFIIGSSFLQKFL
jgi:tryptophan synthase alpha chain